MKRAQNKVFILGLVVGIIIAGIGFGIYTTLAAGEQVDESQQVPGREEGVMTTQKVDTLTYTHPRYGFSLEFPKELAVGRSKEGNASESIVFQKPGEQFGFQIFITPYAQDTITRERMQKDIRGGEISEPRQVVIGDDLRALVFWSQHPTIGRMREVWFIHDDLLYEVSTYESQDEWLANILNTWQFLAEG